MSRISLYGWCFLITRYLLLLTFVLFTIWASLFSIEAISLSLFLCLCNWKWWYDVRDFAEMLFAVTAHGFSKWCSFVFLATVLKEFSIAGWPRERGISMKLHLRHSSACRLLLCGRQDQHRKKSRYPRCQTDLSFLSIDTFQLHLLLVLMIHKDLLFHFCIPWSFSFFQAWPDTFASWTPLMSVVRLPRFFFCDIIKRVVYLYIDIINSGLSCKIDCRRAKKKEEGCWYPRSWHCLWYAREDWR